MAGPILKELCHLLIRSSPLKELGDLRRFRWAQYIVGREVLSLWIATGANCGGSLFQVVGRAP